MLLRNPIAMTLLLVLSISAGCDQTPAKPVATAPPTTSPALTRALPEFHTLTMARGGAAPDVAAELEKLDPALDGWPEEVFVAAAEGVLTDLGARLIAGTPLDLDDVPMQTEPMGRGVDDIRITHPAVRITRMGAVRAGTDATTGLTFAFPVNRAEFEIFGTELRDDVAIASVRAQVAGISDDGALCEVHAIWSTEWSWDDANGLAILRSIDVESQESATGPRSFFTDCTAALFDPDADAAAQLARGTEYWMDHLDRSTGIDPTGRNGIAIGDVDGDGLDDVFVSQNAGLPNLLLRQRPDGSVEDIAPEAGVDWLDFTAGALIIDIDNDGDQDLITAVGPRVLVNYNNGRGRFVTGAALDAPGGANVYMIVAADYDLDGDLDIYGCRFNSTVAAEGMSSPLPYHDANNGPPNALWRNDGGRAFVNVTRDVGLDVNNRRYSFAAGWEDFDEDGDPDLYVANDFGRNNLYRNDGGTFTDMAESAGAVDLGAGMGVSWSDFDLDGDLDVYVSNMYSADGRRLAAHERYKPDGLPTDRADYQRHARGNTLLRNDGSAGFSDPTLTLGVARGHWAWGALFVDFNNDGREDLYVPNGYVSREGDALDLQNFFWRRVINSSPLHTEGPTDAYMRAWAALGIRLHMGASWAGFERNVAYLNCDDRGFADVSVLSGADFDDDSRAVAATDWDHDGDLDLWLLNRTAPQLRFLRNDLGAESHFITMKLQGSVGNRDAIGARVMVHTPTHRLLRTVKAGSGFLSQSSRWLHFGLGDDEVISSIEITWPGGATQTLTDVEVDGRYLLTEGQPLTTQEPRTGATIASRAPGPLTPGANDRGDDGRIVLVEPLPMPPVTMRAIDQTLHALSDHPDTVRLLLVWSSDSARSRANLDMLAAHHDDLAALDLKILAACGNPMESLPFMKQLGAPFPVGWAPSTPNRPGSVDFDRLFILRRVLQRGPEEEFTLPVAFLIDPAERIRTYYFGAIDADQLKADVEALANSREPRLERPGRWLHRPARDLDRVAAWFGERQLLDDARAYLRFKQNGRRP